MSLQEELRKYRYSYEIQVRYSDMDMLGHANNAVYLTYLELARVAYFEDVLKQRSQDIAMVLAHATVDYKKPITPGIRPVARLRVSKMGNSSVTMENIITDLSGEEVYFTSTMVLVAIDITSGRPVPVPEEEKQKIKEYEPVLE